MTDFDAEVLIVGNGPVGATLACLLGSQGISCIVLDARKDTGNTMQGSPDPRALAITHASKNIFQTFDLWSRLPQERIGVFQYMHVWDENGKGDIRFDCEDAGGSALGYIIEQSVLQTALDQLLDFIPAVSIYRGFSPRCLIWHEDKITVEVDERNFRVKLVVAADGVQSNTRKLAGIDYAIRDYEQTAVACIAKTELPHGNTARQRFLTNGPLAFLPMADPYQCGIVWSTSPQHAEHLLSISTGEFNHALADKFSFTLGQVIESGPKAAFPLQRAQAEHYCKERIALIGDAAHCVHPLAGQGANLGLLDAASLAQVLITARNKNKDIGRERYLRQYERWRKGENRFMMLVFEGFKYLFENQTIPIPLLRNAGMDIINTKTTVKRLIMRRAMGQTGDLPEIAKA